VLNILTLTLLTLLCIYDYRNIQNVHTQHSLLGILKSTITGFDLYSGGEYYIVYTLYWDDHMDELSNDHSISEREATFLEKLKTLPEHSCFSI